MTTWQPIETAPKDGTTVWVAEPRHMRLAYWAVGKEFEHNGSAGGGWRDFLLASIGAAADLQVRPIYWMPLPEPPPER
jgi:hypothetical protein